MFFFHTVCVVEVVYFVLDVQVEVVYFVLDVQVSSCSRCFTFLMPSRCFSPLRLD